MEEIAKKHDTLVPWIKWWDMRRSHIFVPFRGASLPGVNLSEIGNAGWKAINTLHLVHAGKQDTATMILQEREMYMFNRNLSKSSGRGPSKAERNSKDRKEQMKVTEDSVNTLDDKQAIQMEAEQANNPCTFIPRGNSKHKPPKTSEIYDE